MINSLPSKFLSSFFSKEDDSLNFRTLVSILTLIGFVLALHKKATLPLPFDVSVALLFNHEEIYGSSFHLDFALSAWSSLHQFGAILLNAGLSHEAISLMFGFIGSISLCIGIGLILRFLTFPIWIILVFVPILSLYSTLPSLTTDYKFLGIGSKNLSHFCVHLIILSFGLVLNRKIASSFFLSALLISVHPFFGLFFFAIIVFYFFQATLYEDEYNKSQRTKILKQAFFGFCLGMIITLISFITFYINFPIQDDLTNDLIDQKIYNAYVELWDIHRNVIPNLSAIIIGLFIGFAFLFLNAVLLLEKKKQFRFFQISLSLILIISCSIYLFTIFVPESNITNFLVIITPGRFMILNGFFIFFLTVSFIIQLSRSISGLSAMRIYSCLIFLIILLFILIFNQDFEPFFSYEYSSLSKTSIFVLLTFGISILFLIFKYFIPFISLKVFKLSSNKLLFISTALINSFMIIGISYSSIKMDDSLDKECELVNKKIPTLVATGKDADNLIRRCQKLVVINPRFIDIAPYIQSSMKEFGEIITIAYGLDFFNPPEALRNSGRLANDNQKPIFQDSWELRSKHEWNEIRYKTGVLEIAAPESWAIDLEKRYTINDSVIYSLE